MRNKMKIELLNKSGKSQGHIFRVLKAESCGNFNPVFCQYNKERYLVKSTEGDLSDPFRREESYLTSLCIEIKD